jgi:hypothetical protein
MTRTNRFANRVILAMIGLLVLGAAAALALPYAATLGVTPFGDAEADAPFGITLPDASRPVVLWTIAGASVLIVAFAVVWILTRGRGRTGTALSIEGATVDASAVQSVLRSSLAGAPDVVVVSVSAHRRRGGPVVLVRVQVRPGPDLRALRSAVHDAIDRLDQVIGIPLPLVVHLTSGVRSTWASARTTH